MASLRIASALTVFFFFSKIFCKMLLYIIQSNSFSNPSWKCDFDSIYIQPIHVNVHFDGALLKYVSRFGIIGLVLPKCEMCSEFDDLYHVFYNPLWSAEVISFLFPSLFDFKCIVITRLRTAAHFLIAQKHTTIAILSRPWLLNVFYPCWEIRNKRTQWVSCIQNVSAKSILVILMDFLV